MNSNPLIICSTKKNGDDQESIHLLLWEIEDCLIVPDQSLTNEMIVNSTLCKMWTHCLYFSEETLKHYKIKDINILLTSNCTKHYLPTVELFYHHSAMVSISLQKVSN